MNVKEAIEHLQKLPPDTKVEALVVSLIDNGREGMSVDYAFAEGES
jgi:hypothetical protein